MIGDSSNHALGRTVSMNSVWGQKYWFSELLQPGHRKSLPLAIKASNFLLESLVAVLSWKRSVCQRARRRIVKVLVLNFSSHSQFGILYL